MIQNVIFDIGNVLTDFRWRDFLRDKGFDDAMIERIAKVSVKSPLWNQYDRGDWTTEEIMQAFVDGDPSIERELHIAYDDVHGMVTIRDYAVEWVRALKAKGCRVFYLSNFAQKAEEDCSDALAFIPYMDGGILSWKERMIKPEPEIYRLLLERYSLKAEECVFIDDTPINVEEAERQGIHGIVFVSKEQVDTELRALGVEI